MQYIHCLLLSLLAMAPSYAQGQIKGSVLDSRGEPLIGASIEVVGTTKGTISELDGSWVIGNLDEGTYQLEISYIGFGTKTVEAIVPSLTSIDVTLEEDSNQLDEVIVVGYGVQRKREVTGNISSVSGERLLETVTPSFEAALQGQAAGVSVIQGSGLAGSGSVIRIRGASSISAGSEPLYVIDGIPLAVDNFLSENNFENGAFNNNPLASLNPNDIESIEVLKDAAAAGIYGSRGTNGVILITTKKAKSNKLQIDFSTRVATSEAAAKPDFLNGEEWLQLRQEAWEHDGRTGTVWIPNYSTENDSEEFRREAYNAASQNNTDWWDELTQTGVKYEANVGARFGTDKVKAYLGASYSDNESYIVGNSLTRQNLRANLDFTPSDRFTAAVRSSLNHSVNDRVQVSYTGGLGDAMSVALPIYPTRNEDGSFWRGYNPDGTIEAASLNAPNPLFGNQNFSGFTEDSRYITNLSATYHLTDRISLTANGGHDLLRQNNDRYEFLQFNGVDTLDRSERDFRNVTNLNGNLLANVDLSRGEKNSLRLLLGTETQYTNTSGYNNFVHRYDPARSGNTIVGGTLYERGSHDAATVDSSGFNVINNDKRTFLSFFSRLNYDIDTRYNFQVSVRADGSSAFGTENKYGVFPTVSAGWIISDEAWFDNKSINFLKLRSSFGLLGNANIPPNQFVGTVQTFGQYNGEVIRYPARLENPDLKWETTRVFDMGLQIGLLDDKAQVELAYYDKYTQDALLNVALPGYFGFGNFFDNIAEILNRGVEATLTVFPVSTKNVRWRSSINAGYNYNEVTDIGGYLPDAVSGGTNDTRVVPGESIGTNYLIPFLGVDPGDGRPIYLDSSGEPTYEYDEANDRRAVGDVLPNFTGGWSNEVSIGAFSVDALLVFSQGFDYYDSSSKRQLAFLTDWNVDRRIADRWLAPGDDTKYPRVALDPASHGNDKEWFNTDLWLEDASYMRLRNANIRYQLPQKLLTSFGASQGSIAIGGTNLLTFTKFSGLDPEVVRDFDNVNDRNLSVNISYLTPPQERSYSFMLNLTF